MPFFYTDDAIVSGSPTGRHLSTVIKRPVVLMSGWDEHAAAVCKVLNDLQPDHPVGTQYAQWCDGDGLPYTADYSYKVDPGFAYAEQQLTAHGYPGQAFKKAADTLSVNWPRPKATPPSEPPRFDYSDVEAACKGPDYSPLEARAAEHYVRQCSRKAPDTERAVRPLVDRIYELTTELEGQGAKLAAVTAELEQPVAVTADLARSLFYAVPGATFPSGSATLKRV